MKTPTKNLMVGLATAMVLGLSTFAFAAVDASADPNFNDWKGRESLAGSSTMNTTVSAPGSGDNCPLCKMARDNARAKLAASYTTDTSSEGTVNK